jgi:hypothetical protein
MASVTEKVAHAAERKAFSVGIDSFLKHRENKEERTQFYLKLVDNASKFYGKGATAERLARVRKPESPIPMTGGSILSIR